MLETLVILGLGILVFLAGVWLGRQNRISQSQNIEHTTQSNARRSVEGFGVIAASVPKITGPAMAMSGALLILFAVASLALYLLP